MVLSQLVSGLSVTAENNELDGSYELSFKLTRDQFGNDENFNATYSNYWMNQGDDNPVFDKVSWMLKDFSIEHELHIEGKADTIKRNMSYTESTFSLEGEILFENIKIPYDKVEVEYYNPAGAEWVKPYLLHYDLYLEKSDGKMILKVPRLEPSDSANTAAKILKVSEIKISEKTIYLDGTSGNDDNDGMSKTTAVKTFEKAKALAKLNQSIKKIIVRGTTEVEGEISLSGTNATIIRDEEFSGYLFKINNDKEATLKDILIDGNGDVVKDKKSLVRVEGTLNINDGAILQNNKIVNTTYNPTVGGAISAYSAVVNMTGGAIKNNQANYGGGIYLDKSTLNMSGGIIDSNFAKRLYDHNYRQYYAAGGGVLAYNGSTVKISENAIVNKNRSDEVGGGISIGGNDSSNSNLFEMTGGTIEANEAGASGGGIFIQGELSTTIVHKAIIKSGKIINNKMDGSGKTAMAFGGGGIYVNGVAENWHYQGHTYHGRNGELELYNAIITDNYAKEGGAGLAACPISKTRIYVNNGVAMYGNNTASGSAKDLYILSQSSYGHHSGLAKYELAKRMLGGVPYNWTDDDGKLLSDDKHSGILPDLTSLSLRADSKGSELTKSLGKVIISGNTSATRGGGIGSNGTITIGTEDSTEVSVEKKWEDQDNKEGNRPEKITVQLIANGKYTVEIRDLDENNEWKTTFKDLPTQLGDENISYSVKEVKVKGYQSKITGNAKDGFIITNKKDNSVEPNVPPTRDVKVTKKWNYIADKNKNYSIDKIEVELYRNGVATDEKLVLSKENNWTGSFTKLPVYESMKDFKIYTYTIKEVGEKKGILKVGEKDFNVTYTGDMRKGFWITNTEKPNIPPDKTPKTDDAYSIFPYILSAMLSGLALMTIKGLRRNSKN